VLEWTIWKTGGERSRVHVTQPTRVMAHCQSSVGLRTDHVSPQPAPPPGFNPYPKDGLGVSTALDLLPIETLARTAPEWAAVDRVLAAPFNRVEELAIRRFSGWKHPMPKSIREATPPELERLYRARLPDGRSMCYVEAVKRYPPLTARDTCDLVMFVSGWITLDASGKPVDPSPDRRRDERDPGDPELDGLVTYCDRLRALFQLPLGIVPAGGELFWVGQWSGWTEEHYVIRRIGARDGKVELSVPGGWCAR
jgi:hypothetical protein